MKKYRLNKTQFAMFLFTVTSIAFGLYMLVDLFRNPAMYLTTF